MEENVLIFVMLVKHKTTELEFAYCRCKALYYNITVLNMPSIFIPNVLRENMKASHYKYRIKVKRIVILLCINDT